MITIANKNYITTYFDVLCQLKEDSNKKLDFKYNYPNTMITCPEHKSGEESNPSCGVLIVGDGTTKEGTVHCFACGFVCTFEELILRHLSRGPLRLGIVYDWLQKNFTQEQERVVDIIVDRRRIKNKAVKYIQEEELATYRYTCDYMYERKLTDDIIEDYDIGYQAGYNHGGRKINCITMPVRDFDGNCLWVLRRNLQGGYIIPPNVVKPIYGWYELNKQVVDTLYVCEGVIDCLTLVSWGYNAISLLGLGSNYQASQIKSIPARTIVIALDGDSAGWDATYRLMHSKLLTTKIKSYITLPNNKDINNLTKHEFDILEQNR